MKVWSCVFSNDEMVSDSYKYTEVFDGAGLEFKAKYVVKGSDAIAIGDEELEDEGPGETVLNIVDAHQLNELALDKKALMGVIKALMKRTSGHLKENGKSEDEVKAFQKGATDLVKFVIGKFDEMQVFCGKSFDTEASICFCWTKDGEEDPTFLYLPHTMKEEKF